MTSKERKVLGTVLKKQLHERRIELELGEGDLVSSVNELLKLGIENKARMIVLVPTKPSESLQATIYARCGQIKVHIVRDLRGRVVAIRSRLKLLAGMTISRKDIEQFGRIVFQTNNGGKTSEVVISVTATPTKYGEVIILVF